MGPQLSAIHERSSITQGQHFTSPHLAPNPEIATRFLNTAWGDPLPGNVLIWTTEKKVGKVEPKKLSYWLTSSKGLQGIVNAFARERNIYMGVGLPGPDTPRTQFNRCESAEIAGLCGLYGDIDFADPNAPAAHRKENLPPNCEAALELIEAMPVPPTVIIHSGHGLQPYWLFSTPWMFAGATERDQAKDLSYSWNARLIQLAKERGWQMDSVFDLARVLRVPGTLNLKPDCPPVSVRVLQWDGPKYSPNELAGVVPIVSSPPPVTTRSSAGQTGRLELEGAWVTDTAEPPAEKFEAAYRNSKKFADSWDRQRLDLADQSGSGYDFSLATLAATFGWLDAEIVALLIAHHRKHGTDPKLDRPRYYSHTIGKARAAIAERDRGADLTQAEIQTHIGKYHQTVEQMIPVRPLPRHMQCQIYFRRSENLNRHWQPRSGRNLLLPAPGPDQPPAYAGSVRRPPLQAQTTSPGSTETRPRACGPRPSKHHPDGHSQSGPPASVRPHVPYGSPPRRSARADIEPIQASR